MLRASDILSSCKRSSKVGCAFADIKRGAYALASGGIRISGCNLSQSVKLLHGAIRSYVRALVEPVSIARQAEKELERLLNVGSDLRSDEVHDLRSLACEISKTSSQSPYQIARVLIGGCNTRQLERLAYQWRRRLITEAHVKVILTVISNTGSLQDCLLPVTDKDGRNFS